MNENEAQMRLMKFVRPALPIPAGASADRGPLGAGPAPTTVACCNLHALGSGAAYFQGRSYSIDTQMQAE